MDVRMLGRGRPFIIHLNDAKMSGSSFTAEQILELQNSINTNKVHVVDLQVVQKDATKILMEGEKSKKKQYRSLVRISPPLDSSESESKLLKLNQLEPFSIQQKTPIRVLHRRSLLTRERTIYSLICTNINNHMIYVDQETQAGTYVKEFIHGDLGRTRPSMASLMDWGEYECEILLLDVLKIDLDFPPQITENIDVNVPSMEEELRSDIQYLFFVPRQRQDQ